MKRSGELDLRGIDEIFDSMEANEKASTISIVLMSPVNLVMLCTIAVAVFVGSKMNN